MKTVLHTEHGSVVATFNIPLSKDYMPELLRWGLRIFQFKTATDNMAFYNECFVFDITQQPDMGA